MGIQSAAEREPRVLTVCLYHQTLTPGGERVPQGLSGVIERGASLGDGVEKPVWSRSAVQDRPIWWRTLCLGPKDGEELQGEATFHPHQPRHPIL